MREREREDEPRESVEQVPLQLTCRVEKVLCLEENKSITTSPKVQSTPLYLVSEQLQCSI